MLGISKEIVHGLPEVHYPGRVILIDSAAKAKSAVAFLLKQRQIGFDTETRPSFQKNHHYKVSLVQLSVPGECFLFRLKQIGSLDGLMSIFENPDIQKIGLSLKDDFHSLAKLCEFTPAGFVELQTFVKKYEIADNSLQKIFALIFGQRISKNQRLTNWEAPVLTFSQQAYAAIDAWACVEIYNHLCAGKFHPEECPYHIDDETAIMLQSSVGIHWPLTSEPGAVPSVPQTTAKPKAKPKTAKAKAEKPKAEKPAKEAKAAKPKKDAKPKAAKATKTEEPVKEAKPKKAAKPKAEKPAKEAKPKDAKKSTAKKPAAKKSTAKKPKAEAVEA
jgi:hypothetical protein